MMDLALGCRKPHHFIKPLPLHGALDFNSRKLGEQTAPWRTSWQAGFHANMRSYLRGNFQEENG